MMFQKLGTLTVLNYNYFNRAMGVSEVPIIFDYSGCYTALEASFMR